MAPSIVQAAVSLIHIASAYASVDSRYATVFEKRAAGVSAVLPGTWTLQGCYTDPGPRTLTGASYTNNTAMTEESCIAFCDSNGAYYAGVEYSQECCKYKSYIVMLCY